MIKPEFSIRGPHGSVPWIALVTEPVDGAPDRIVPALAWARTSEEAKGYLHAAHRDATNIQMFGANSNHHLGAARVVPLARIE